MRVQPETLEVDWEVIHEWYRDDADFRALVDEIAITREQADMDIDYLLRAVLAVYMFTQPYVLNQIRMRGN